MQRDVKLAKENFFEAGINRCKGNSGKLWRHLGSLGHSKGVSSSRIVLEENGGKVFDSYGVACMFNRFYSSIASSLVAKLPNPYGLYVTSSRISQDFYQRKRGLCSNFTLSPVSTYDAVSANMEFEVSAGV